MISLRASRKEKVNKESSLVTLLRYSNIVSYNDYHIFRDKQVFIFWAYEIYEW